MTLTWPSAAGAATYNLYWTEGKDVNLVTGKPITNVTSPYVHEGRQNGRVYSYVVTSVNQGLLESDGSNRVTVTPKEPPPGAPKVEIIPGYERLTLWWQPVANASSYVGYISEEPGIAPGGGRPVSLPPLVYENLQVGKPYYFVVAAINAAGESTESLELSGSPSASPLSPPSFIQVSNADGANQFKWSAVEQAKAYRIYWGTKSPVNQGNQYFTVNGLTYLHDKLTSGTRYYYRISAKNDFIESPLSHEMSIIARANPPQGPTGLTAKAGNGSVELDWTPMANAGTYNLYYDRNGVKNAIPNVTPPYVHDSLEKTAYTYEVTAIIDGVESEASYAVSAIPLFPPAVPTELAVDAGEAVIGLSWKASAGAIGYNIYWIEDEPVTKDNGTLIGSVSNPYYHSGLDPSKTYHYRVSAVNGDGESELSEEIPGKALAPPPPKVDLVVTAADINLSAGATVSHGQSVTVTYTVANLGNKSTAEESPWARGFYVGFDLSVHTGTNVYGSLGYKYYDQIIWVADLPPGESYTGTFEYVIRKKGEAYWKRYEDGTQYMRVHVDAWNNQLEGNENNNEYVIESAPLDLQTNDNEDLSITGITGVQADVSQGTPLNLTTTVVNTGTAPAYKNWLKYYLVDRPDLPVNIDSAIKIGDSRLAGVGAGGQLPVVSEVYIPVIANPDVTYYLAAQVDGDDEQTELDEDNNWFINAQPMTVAANLAVTGPDIQVTATTAGPLQSQYVIKSPIAIDITVINNGDLPYVDQKRNSDVATMVTLEPAPLNANADPDYPNSQVYFTVPALNPGISKQIQTWLYNGNPYLDYYGNRLQRFHQWPEAGLVSHLFGHNGNTAAGNDLQLNLVDDNNEDLVISAASVSKTKVTSAEAVDVSFTVSNIGTSDAGGFFVHMNILGGHPSWFVADVWIPQLRAGESSSRLINVSLPNLVDGVHNLDITADYIRFNEVDETNNTRSIPLQFSSDVDVELVGVDIQSPGELRAGGILKAKLTYRNNGTTPAFCCNLGWVSVDSTVTGILNYMVLSNYELSAEMLNPGATQTLAFELRLPYFLLTQPYILNLRSTSEPHDTKPENNELKTTINVAAMETTADGVLIQPNNIPQQISQNAVMQGHYVINKSLTVLPDAMLRIKAGSVLEFAAGTGLTVMGGLHVDGVQGNPVTFTSLTKPVAASQWNGITVLRQDLDYQYILYNSNLLMNYAIIEGAETGLHYEEGKVGFSRIRNNGVGVHIFWKASPGLSNSEISNNATALLIRAFGQTNTNYPKVVINDNNIINNTVDLDIRDFPTTKFDLNIMNNWWGAAAQTGTVVYSGTGNQPNILYGTIPDLPLGIVF